MTSGCYEERRGGRGGDTVFSRHGEVTRERAGAPGGEGVRAKINENEINYKTV